MEYFNFDLRIEKTPKNKRRASYWVRVQDCPAGQTVRMSIPASFHRLQQIQQNTDPEKVGRELYTLFFSGDVHARLKSSQVHADQANKGLRIRIFLNEVPELANLPWEHLHDSSDFLALSRKTPIVRYLEMPEAAHTTFVATSPLRVLVVISNPTDCIQLDVEQERASLFSVLEPVCAQGQFLLELLPKPTKSDYNDATR
jgi:hypothetical protein